MTSHGHTFAPPKGKTEKISFECSLPQPVSSTKRVTKALPFSMSISETLDYSAAYVDHAAFLAKHAMQQFEYLQKDHSDLHKVSENRAKEISELECKLNDFASKYCGLENKYAQLKKHHDEEYKETKAKEALLQKQLKQTQDALKSSESNVAGLKKHIAELVKYIAKDKLEDLERDRQHHDHIDADHLLLKQAEERAVKAEKEVERLTCSIKETSKKLAVAEATLKTVREQLSASQATVAKLTTDLAEETKAKAKFEADLKDATGRLEEAKCVIVGLQSSITAKDALITKKDGDIKARDETIKTKDDTITRRNETIAEEKKEVAKLRAENKKMDKETADVRTDRDEKAAKLDVLNDKYEKALEANHKDCEETLAATKSAFEKDLALKEQRILDLQAHHTKVHEVPKTDVKVGVAEIRVP